GLRGKLDADEVIGAYFAASQNDAHDTRLANEVALCIAIQDGCQEALLKVVQLGAGVAQAGHLDHCLIAQVEARAGRQAKQIDAARGDVLAHITSGYGKAGSVQFLMQFRMDQMDLAQVGLARVARYPRAMLDLFALMGIAFYSQSGQKTNAVLVLLAEG